jgi:hypothetical protein
MKKTKVLERILTELQSIDSALNEIIRLLGQQNMQSRQLPEVAPYDFTTAPKVAPWAELDSTGVFTPRNVEVTSYGTTKS